MSVNEPMLKGIFDALNSAGKYVSLDLSGSPLTKIPKEAFIDIKAEKGCATLAGIIIPKGVTSIGDGAFISCTSLKSITIPDSVTKIWHEAFKGCTNLTSVIIPNSVTVIQGEAFRYCTSLTNVTIPNSVTYIAGWAFAGCGLTSVTFQGTIANLDNAFDGDLRAKYRAGGIGTYTTTTPGVQNSVWTKQ
jgi:hypothetical protein